MDEGSRRNVFRLGVSATMFPMRSFPFQFAVTGGASEADGAVGLSTVLAAFASGVGAAAGGFAEGGASGGLGVPSGGCASGSRRPNRAAARRILKKYMDTIASANATSNTIVKR